MKTSEDLMLKSAELLGWALGGLEREIEQTKARLTALSREAERLRARLGRSGAAGRLAPAVRQGPAGDAAPTRRRRKMSAEARRRISEKMRERWAERRKQAG